MKRWAIVAVTVVTALFVWVPAYAACHSASFDPAAYQVRERDGRVRITVENPGAAPGDRRVDYETVDGSAKAGSDYTARSGTLAFTITDRTETIEIPITNDSSVEGAETFQVRLKARNGSCIQSLGDPATVTISDDDQAATQPPATQPPTGTPGTNSPTPTSTSPSPTVGTSSPTPSPPDDGGGLGGGAVAGIVGGVVAVGGVAAFIIRRRLLS